MGYTEDKVGGATSGWGEIRIPFQIFWLDLPSTAKREVKKEGQKLAKEAEKDSHTERGKPGECGGLKARRECVSGRMELSTLQIVPHDWTEMWALHLAPGRSWVTLIRAVSMECWGQKSDHCREWGEKNWRQQVQTLFPGVCHKGGREMEQSWKGCLVQGAFIC